MIMGISNDDRPLLYKDKQYVMNCSDGWVDVRDLSVHIQRTRRGVRLEVWPIETDGKGEPLSVLEVDEPKGASGPAPRKRISNQVRHIKHSGDWL
jgi:hypothetical protein